MKTYWIFTLLLTILFLLLLTILYSYSFSRTGIIFLGVVTIILRILGWWNYTFNYNKKKFTKDNKVFRNL
ncbi:hypothetical protein BMEGG_05627 [Priestia megaterium]